MEGVTLTTDTTMTVREEEPQGLDVIAGVAPSSSSSAVSAASGLNSTLVEIRFITPTGAREHTFVAKRSLIEAYFPGLGGMFQPSVDRDTQVLFHEIHIPWLDNTASKLAWSGKLAEEAYQYYDHYLTTGGKFPSFKDAVLPSTDLKDVPGVTDYELKLFRTTTPEEVDHSVNLLSVVRYICSRSGPCHDFGVMALTHIYDSRLIDEALRLLRLDGKENELTPEERDQIVQKHAYMFNSWLTPPPVASSSNQTASSANPSAKDDVADLPVVELD